MNEKVTEKWFEENGWTPSIFYLNNTIDGRGRVTTERIITYMLNNGSTTLKGYSQARWDHTIRVTRDKRGKVVGASNWYSLSVSGKGFHIENRIAYRRFSIEQVESALKIVGLK
jgi:hypothetical protein